MPPKSKRAKYLEKSGEAKQQELARDHGSETEESRLEERDGEPESSDSDSVYSPSATDRETANEQIAEHVQDWVSILSRDVLQSLSLCLHHVLVTQLGMQLTATAGTIGEVIG